MQPETGWLAAFVMGIVGAGHCLAMCGGITTALAKAGDSSDFKRKSLVVLFYNLGRIGSYTIAGLLIGGFGQILYASLPFDVVNRVAPFLSGFLLVALGLYLAGWWHGLLVLEKLGAMWWRKIQPLSQRVLPVRRIDQAFFAGLLWGWLPCGLVYTALSWALVSGNAWRGAGIMLIFGIATLPSLWIMGMLAHNILAWSQKPMVRTMVGGLLIVFGIVVFQGVLIPVPK